MPPFLQEEGGFTTTKNEQVTSRSLSGAAEPEPPAVTPEPEPPAVPPEPEPLAVPARSTSEPMLDKSGYV